MKGSRIGLVVGFTMVLVGGCDAPAEEREVIRRDSAGITVVESLAPQWEDGGAWRLARDPEMSIGGLDAPVEEQLFGVRGAVRLDDGGVITAHASTSELRFYTADGQFVRAVGGQGEGPREFGYIYYMRPFGADSVLIWDSGNARYAVYDRDGNFGRVFTLTRGGDGVIFPGSYPVVLSDRTIFGFAQLPVGDQEPGLYEAQVTYHRFGPDGSWLGEFQTVPFRTFSLRRSGEDIAMTPAPFGREAVLAPADTTVWLGLGDGYVLERYSAAGELQARIVDGTYTPVPVEQWHLEEAIDERLEQTRRMAERMGNVSSGWMDMQRANIQSLEAPETFPPYSRIMVDEVDNLWVRDYALPGEPNNRWTVFDTDGVLLGRLTVPERFQIAQIGSDWMLGLWQDDLDLEYLQLYRIEKGGAGPG